MGRPLRYLPLPSTTFEITCRCIHGRLLLRPSARLNQLVLGIIGRALSLYPVQLHLLIVTSNHIHFILTTNDIQLLALFMDFVNGNIAREAGRLHSWREKFWGRRYRAIPILDDESLVGRVRYLLAHGCKEGLVLKPQDWPGVNCVQSLTQGKVLQGTWFNRTAEYNAKRRGIPYEPYQFATHYEVPLAPLPCWAGLTVEEQRMKAREVVEDIERESRERRKRKGKSLLGAGKILSQHPHTTPLQVKRSPAPQCHAATSWRRKIYRCSYRFFMQLYRAAARRLADGDLLARFPEHCFPPARPYIGLLVNTVAQTQ